MEELHKPVLLSEVLALLRPEPGEAYLDLTAGYAGHASEILDATRDYKRAVLVDRDEFAVEFLRGKYAGREPVKIVNSDFCSAALQLIECGNTFDMCLMDLGVSSPQLDMAGRGFSFQKDGPLDMRMDRRQELDAERIINTWSAKRLTEIFEKYGEEKPGRAQRIARMIVSGRPWESTGQLAKAIAENTRHGGKSHPATRVFQAVRIAVNDELGLLSRTLPLLPKLLKPGGRLAIITFHSLEDRLVKDFFKEASAYGEESELEIVNKKPIRAESMELFINPRARSAKLRGAKKRG